MLSGIADIEYEYDYDTGEFLGLKEDNEATTVAPDSSETTTELPTEDSTELNVTDNEVDVGDPRQPKALDDDDDDEEFDPYKRVKVGCCWYAAIQIAENQKSRQPKSLGFENQSTSGGGQLLRGGRNLGTRKRRPRRGKRRRKSKLPLDRVISSLNNLINRSLKSLLVQPQPQKPPVPRRPFHRPG